MKLDLKRIFSNAQYTIGRLYIDGVYFCDTLEDCLRDSSEKLPGKTAVPVGAYKLMLSESPRFKRILPLLINVPNFEGVRIHPGNTAEDTEGCFLVGENKAKGRVLNSRATFERLFVLLWAAQERGEEMSVEIK